MNDKEYQEYLENVVKLYFPEEYALLKSDLLTNMKKRPWPREQRDMKQEFPVHNKALQNLLRYGWDPID